VTASSSGISGAARAQLARLTSRGRFIVAVDDAVARLEMSRFDAAKLLARWAEQGWLRRVRRGLYVAVPVDVEHPEQWSADPLVLATAVWSPCYFTGWTAANHWGLTEQIFQTTVVRTTARVRSSEQTLLDHRYLLGHVPEERLEWGVRPLWIAGSRVVMADEARVVVDMLDDPSIGGGIRHAADILVTYLQEHDRNVLLAYADRLGNGAVYKRLGYLCDAMDLTDEGFLERCEGGLSEGISDLDPTAATKGERVTRWRLRVNVELERRSSS
jgi:predicted transcriptional regulator of viral defense system